MPPSLALLLWFVLLLLLLRYDPAKDPATSAALWVPLTWALIVASRLPSQWFGTNVGSMAQAYQEGNPLDRSIFFVLILLAMGILMARSFGWGTFILRNLPLMAFLCFALLSVFWSDFPFVSLKRWFRDLGTYLMILVVLSDPRPLEGVRTVLRRLAYLLIPLSIVLIKYYPQIGKGYGTWTGTAVFVGVTTNKNTLGVLCLVGGIFFFWDTVTRWASRKERRTRRILVVNCIFLVMTLWLMKLAHSATSSVCFLIGCLVIAAAHSNTFKRRPGFLKALIPICSVLYVILAFGFDINGQLAAAVGRDPTLTDRTFIWKLLLSMNTNPLIGTGYEGFWMGSRLEWFSQKYGANLNEAHNGYLEVYLNLGLIGLCLLGGLLIAGYRTVSKKLKPFSNLASLSLALWTVTIFYNVTEAAFKYHLIWMVFLAGVMNVPGYAGDQESTAAAVEKSASSKQFMKGPRKPRIHRGTRVESPVA